MNLREFNTGTPQTKGWFNPVCRSLTCEDLNQEGTLLGSKFVGQQDITVGNTTTFTSLFPDGAGNLTFEAGELKDGFSFEAEFHGVLNWPGIGFEIESALGDGTIQVGSLVSGTVGTGIQNFKLLVRTVIRGVDTVRTYFELTTVDNGAILLKGFSATSVGAIDFSQAQTYDVSLKYSALNPGETLTVQSCELRRTR